MIREDRESLIELVFRLIRELADLAGDEINLARQEVREKIRTVRSGIVSVAFGIALGLIAVLTLDAALVIALGTVIGFGLSALVAGVAMLIGALILAGMGMARIRKTHLKLEKTLLSLKENGEWLKRAVHSR